MWKTIVKEKNVYCVVPGKQNDRYAQYRRVLEIEKPINDTKQIVVEISSRSDKKLEQILQLFYLLKEKSNIIMTK